MRALLLSAALATLLLACGGDDDTADEVADAVAPVRTDDAGTTPPSRSSVVVDPDVTLTPTPGPTAAVRETGPTGSAEEAAAIADLAARAGADEAAITVVSTQEVTWRDGAVGCPEPGVAYTQALVPGVRVVLELDGVRHEYHAGGARAIFYCARPEPPAEG